MSRNLEQGKLLTEREVAIQKMKSEIFYKELIVGISFVINWMIIKYLFIYLSIYLFEAYKGEPEKRKRREKEFIERNEKFDKNRKWKII